MRLLPFLMLCSACTASVGPVPWTGAQPRLGEVLPTVRGQTWSRAIVHLHSPWSHDACDGDPLPDGVPDEACLQDLREGLCIAGIDAAFVTDHPDHASFQDFAELTHPRPGDVAVAGGSQLTCADGSVVTWLPGLEDELMPIGLDRHVSGDADTRHEIYNKPDAVDILKAVGATVLVAHTEQRELSDLRELQDAGIAGVEIFNLHAMFAPDIRSEYLGLDGLGWVTDVAPFTRPDGTGEPDLLFLPLLQEQRTSVVKWDALLERGPAVAVGGTDAHQNTLPVELRDGERGDSYRRMFRWFSNHLLVGAPGPDAAQRAITAGRSWLVFEILGLPEGLDLYLDDGGGVPIEIGGTGTAGELTVGCPTLSATSPRGDEEPEIVVQLLRDGQPWREGCGRFPAEAGHVYRVRVNQVPRHLRPFLGDDPEPWLRSYPWAYSNAIRVE